MVLNNDHTIKRLYRLDGVVKLIAENMLYPSITVKDAQPWLSVSYGNGAGSTETHSPFLCLCTGNDGCLSLFSGVTRRRWSSLPVVLAIGLGPGLSPLMLSLLKKVILIFVIDGESARFKSR